MHKIKAFLANNMFLRETTWAFMAKGTAFVSFYLILIFLTRSMTVDQWGKWSLFFSLYTVAFQFFNFGMPFSVKHFFARYKDSDSLPSVIRSVLKTRLLLNLIILFLLALLTAPVLAWLDRSFLKSLMYLALPTTFIYAFVEVFRAGFEGFHKLKNVFFLNLIEHGLKLVLVVSFFLYFKTFESILYAFIVSFMLATVFGFVKLLKSFYDKRSMREDTEIVKIKSIILYCIPAFILGFLILLPGQFGIILLNKLHGDHETGIFTAAHQLIKYAPQISVAISMGTMPVFANLNQDNLAKFKTHFRRILLIILGVFCALAILFLLMGHFIIEIGFGTKFTDSVEVLYVLLPFMIQVGIMTVLTSLLNYWGMIRKLMISYLLSTSTGIILMFLLIPSMGAIGLALALSCQVLPNLVLCVYFIWKKVRSFDIIGQ